MPAWDETTPYTERSTFSRNASVTNAYLGVHVLALAASAVCQLVNWPPYRLSTELRTLPALFDLEVWRFITYPFAHPVDPASLVAFAVLGWLFLKAGNELEREWGGARMFGFCTALALYGGTAHAVYQVARGAAADPLSNGAGGFHAPVIGVLLAQALRNPRRPALLFMLIPTRTITLFWLTFGGALLYGVLVALRHEGPIAASLPSPVAMAGAAGAAWVYHRIDPRLDRFLEWLDTRRARARFLEEFELRAQVDVLLEKIQKGGMESLTRQERKALKRASGLYKPQPRDSHE